MCFGHRLAFTALGLPPFEPSFASLEPSEHLATAATASFTISADWLRICGARVYPWATRSPQ